MAPPAASRPIRPAYDPHYHFQLAIDAGLSAYAAPLGMIEAGADSFAGADPDHPQGEQLQLPGHRKDQAVTGSVDDALRLGCSAIGFTIYPGSEYAFDQMEEMRELADGGQGGGSGRRHVELSARRDLSTRPAKRPSTSAPMPRIWRR